MGISSLNSAKPKLDHLLWVKRRIFEQFSQLIFGIQPFLKEVKKGLVFKLLLYRIISLFRFLIGDCKVQRKQTRVFFKIAAQRKQNSEKKPICVPLIFFKNEDASSEKVNSNN